MTSVELNRRISPIEMENRRLKKLKVEPADQTVEYKPGKWSLFSDIKAFICFFTSCITSAVVLMILMMCAIVTYYASGRHERNKAESRNSEKLPKNERKLTSDLKYYMKLSGLDTVDYTVTTFDGFNLQVQRLVNSHESDSQRAQRYPVLLVHGLMQSSAAFCTSGENSIALELFRRGYDVWLGNNRCGFTPSHVIYSRWNVHMWQWSLKEMGTLDLPCMVDFVRTSTGAEKIGLVAHSQGTAETFFALASNSVPDLGEKLSSFSALAPAVYAGPLLKQKWFLRSICYLNHHVYHVMFGHHAFIGSMSLFRSAIPLKIYTYFGYIMLSYLLGWNDTLWNDSFRDRQFVFSPVFVSAELMYWWLGPHGFAAKGCVLNEEADCWFDKEILPALAIFAPGRDDLCNAERLVNRLRTYEKLDDRQLQVFDLPSYGHLDVLWAADVKEKVAEPLAKFIYENIGETTRDRYGMINVNGMREE